MIHDLVNQPQDVYLTYTLYFIPDTAPEAANITPIDTQWMDVQGVKPYPVFNALKGKGTKTRRGRPSSPTRTRPRTRTRPTGSCATSGSSTTTRRSSARPATSIPAACTPI